MLPDEICSSMLCIPFKKKYALYHLETTQKSLNNLSCQIKIKWRDVLNHSDKEYLRWSWWYILSLNYFHSMNIIMIRSFTKYEHAKNTCKMVIPSLICHGSKYMLKMIRMFFQTEAISCRSKHLFITEAGSLASLKCNWNRWTTIIAKMLTSFNTCISP
jgi:hypothetical protein